MAPRLQYIPDILEEHLDEFAFLWGVRQGDLRSPDEPFRSFLDTEERVAAHLQGVVVVADKAEEFLLDRLSSDDPDEAFAAAAGLLGRGGRAAARVVEAFRRTTDAEDCASLGEALLYGPANGTADSALQEIARSEVSFRAVAAARVLAGHGSHDPVAELVPRWRASDDPSARTAAWTITGWLDLDTDARAWASGLRDTDPGPRTAALEAAAWAGVGGVIEIGRIAARDPSPDRLADIYLLAVLGGPVDRDLILGAAAEDELGMRRYDILVAYAAPAVVPFLLDRMDGPDAAEAATAARAFTTLTGVDVTSQEVVEVPAEDEGDEFDREFREQVTLPDPETARRAWKSMAPRLDGATRICCGEDIERGVSPEAFREWPMATRWEYFLRTRFTGAWKGSPFAVQRFPQVSER